MALVEFVNDSAPYLNAENLNNNFDFLNDNKLDISSGIKIYPSWTLPTSLDNLPSGAYLNSSISGAPNTYTNVIICVRFETNRAVQLCITPGTAETWVRGINGGNWSNWSKLN